MPETPHAHDRVAMPSRRADGSLDQNAPELIGPVDEAAKGITHQLQTQAAAAVDEKRDGGDVKAALSAAETAARAEVSQLHPKG
jgi:hypothetical protein